MEHQERRENKDWFEHDEHRRESPGEVKKRHNPMGGIVFGLMVIWLGLCFYLKYRNIISADIWWAYLLVGFGGLWILGGLIQLFVSGWRHHALGSFIPGIVVGAVGLMFILESFSWWPMILIAVGFIIVVVVLVQYFSRRRRDEDIEV
jgi:hypothetical protein